MKYEVEIVETLSRTVAVEADDANAAEEEVRRKYRNSEIVLSSDDYEDTDFIVKNEG